MQPARFRCKHPFPLIRLRKWTQQVKNCKDFNLSPKNQYHAEDATTETTLKLRVLFVIAIDNILSKMGVKYSLLEENAREQGSKQKR